MAGIRVGAEGGGSECVASGAVVQWWCSGGARLVAAGVPVRMDDGDQTLGDSKTARIRGTQGGRAQSSICGLR
jgi:hypothetical protein